MDKFEIVVAGVGGQGVLLLGTLLDRAARFDGIQTIIGSEIHGMAQRGGSLISYTRLGKGVYGPIISVGCADVIIGLEYIEGLRNIERLSENGCLMVSDTKRPSSTLWLTDRTYPEKESVFTAMKKSSDNVSVVSAEEIAGVAGNIRASNVVMLGAAVAGVEGFPISRGSFLEAIRMTLPEKLVDVNIKAFEAGVEAMS